MKQISEATDDDIELYTQGSCHVFAIALCQLYGFKPVVVLDEEGETQIDEDDEEVFHNYIIHVYAEDTKNNIVYDINGSRAYKGINQDIEDNFPSCSVGHIVDCNSVEDLMENYVDSPDSDDKYLHSISEQDLIEAKQKAIALFGPPTIKKIKTPSLNLA